MASENLKSLGWKTGTVSITAGSGTLVSSMLIYNEVLHLGYIEFQVNGASQDTVLTMSILSTNVAKPIYAFNQYDNVPVCLNMQSYNISVSYAEKLTLVRCATFFPM